MSSRGIVIAGGGLGRRPRPQPALGGRPPAKAPPRPERCSAPSPPPSIWSNQHGIRIQYLGDAHGADRIALEGDPPARDFTATVTRLAAPTARCSSAAPTRSPNCATAHVDEVACAAHGDCALAAARACPAGAITATDATTGDPVYP